MRSAFVCDAIRTPFGRFGGALASVRPDDLAALTLRALLDRSPKLDPAAVDDVILGCANQAGEDNRNVARMALLLAGLPESVPGATINRLCGSSLDAAATAARAIVSGDIEVAIAAGVESMSRAPLVLAKADTAWSRTQKLEDSTLGWRFINPQMKERYGVDSMAETAENVAAEHGIARVDQDAFAFRSQQRADAAARAGFLAEEIVPVPISKKPSVERDEHPRPDTTLEALAALRPVVRPGGCVTAGNASGINDGAAALLLAGEAAAARYGLTPRARIVASAVAGVAPRIMGIGPVPAVQKLLARTGLAISQIDAIELNEAFAARLAVAARARSAFSAMTQPTPIPTGFTRSAISRRERCASSETCCPPLPNARALATRCTMCIGVGQGIAMILERCV
ncbi:MAG: acetyl-CoA C-acyltransferase [Bryobacteraceae bacterium]